MIYTQNIGPYSNDFTTNYTINLPTDYLETTLSATVTDCDGNSITKGYAVIGNDLTAYTKFVSITNGTLNYNLIYCSSNYYIQVYDATNQVNSNEISLTLSETTINLGTLSACGNDTTYQIGDLAFGGIIFYLDGNGGGKVCALDDSSGSPWTLDDYHNSSVLVGRAQSDTDGAANTDFIIEQTGAPAANTYAAGSCRLYSTPGNNDQGLWYLPAKDELDLLWTNLADSDGDGENTGLDDPNNIGGYGRTSYWSSTESDYAHVWEQNFVGGNQTSYHRKYDVKRVRAVRAF